MKKDFNIKKWVYDRVNDLKQESRRSKTRSGFLTFFLFIINLTTLAAAGLALYLLFTEFDEFKSRENFLPFVFTFITLAFIILTFFMQIVNTIYKSRMKDSIYKASINSLKIEIVKFENRIGDYAKKDARERLESIVLNIENNIRYYKRTKVKFRNAFYGTIVGGK